LLLLTHLNSRILNPVRVGQAERSRSHFKTITFEIMKIQPKKENENVGFHYTVTDEQLAARAKMTTEEILNWVEETPKFTYEL
jgi:hypothetical protein